jgi:hypothetical protein
MLCEMPFGFAVHGYWQQMKFGSAVVRLSIRTYQKHARPIGDAATVQKKYSPSRIIIHRRRP